MPPRPEVRSGRPYVGLLRYLSVVALVIILHRLIQRVARVAIDGAAFYAAARARIDGACRTGCHTVLIRISYIIGIAPATVRMDFRLIPNPI